ncbi:MAG: 50S ribosomal protein L4, partial [Patescibacteria group bacterium]
MSVKINVYNQEAKVVGEVKLSDKVFALEANSDLIHQALVAQMSNERQVLAHTKTKAEVRGGGKKPWKQKGTGRARAGSSRSPIWVGGGVTFGPRKDRNFTKKINKK